MDLASIVFHLAEWIGILAFSISGAMVAIDHKLDLFGVIILGIITSLGGGMVRDLLLGQAPPRLFSNYGYVLLSFCVSIFVFATVRKMHHKNGNAWNAAGFLRLNNVFDAIGLGAFTVTGVQMAILYGYGSNLFLSISLGVITGVGGGMLRDIAIRETPEVLVKHIYALAAILGALTYYTLACFFTIDQRLCLLAGVIVTVATRLLSTHFRWSLPKA